VVLAIEHVGVVKAIELGSCCEVDQRKKAEPVAQFMENDGEEAYGAGGRIGVQAIVPDGGECADRADGAVEGGADVVSVRRRARVEVRSV
jgi:hypothetical protein